MTKVSADQSWRDRLRAELHHQDQQDALDDIDAVAGDLESFAESGDAVTDTTIGRDRCGQLAARLRAAIALLQDATS